MLYKTHWAGLSEPSWEREMDLQLSRSYIMRYWAGTPDQHCQTNRLYRLMRIGAAQRELSRNNGAATGTFPSARLRLCSPCRVSRKYHDTVLPNGVTFVQGKPWFMVAWTSQREHSRGHGMPGLLFGQPGTD